HQSTWEKPPSPHLPRCECLACTQTRDMLIKTHIKEEPPQESILEEAQRIISGDRRDSYGDYRKESDQIADMWSAILGFNVEPRKVPLCVIAVKLNREAHKPARDNRVDMCGYAGLADQVVDNPPRKP